MGKRLGKIAVPMPKDVFMILKAVTFKLDAETACIATYQYHTEKDDSGKTIRAKSGYRWLARVFKIADAQAEVERLNEDKNRLERWVWPDDPTWDKYICIGSDSNNAKFSSWLKCRLKKMVDWDLGQKLLNGWSKCDQDYNLNAKYDTDGYTAPDGTTVSLADREALLKLVGKNLWKDLPRNLKAKAQSAKLEELKTKTGPGSDVITKQEYDKLSKEEKKAYIVTPGKDL